MGKGDVWSGERGGKGWGSVDEEGGGKGKMWGWEQTIQFAYQEPAANCIVHSPTSYTVGNISKNIFSRGTRKYCMILHS